MVSGHNWGSQHDPLTRECVPASSEGGRFVMYMHSVSGRELNNKVGSRDLPDSIRFSNDQSDLYPPLCLWLLLHVTLTPRP